MPYDPDQQDRNLLAELAEHTKSTSFATILNDDFRKNRKDLYKRRSQAYELNNKFLSDLAQFDEEEHEQ